MFSYICAILVYFYIRYARWQKETKNLNIVGLLSMLIYLFDEINRYTCNPLALLTCGFLSSTMTSPFPSLFLRERMESRSSSLIRGNMFFSFPALSTAFRRRGSLTSKAASSIPSNISLSSLRTLPEEVSRSRGEDREFIIGKFPGNG